MGNRKNDRRKHTIVLKKANELAEIKAKNEKAKAERREKGDVVIELRPDGTVKRKIIM